MHNFLSRRTNSSQRDRLNANLFEQSLSAHIYNHWIPPGDFHDISATTIPTFYNHNNTIFAGWAFSDSDRYSVGCFVPRDREWRKGVVSIIPFVSFDSNTGDVAIYSQLWSVVQGDTVNAWPTAGSGQDKIITATANPYEMYKIPETIFLSDAAWTVEVDDYTVGIQVVVGRNGASGSDTMSGDLYFHGAILKYIEGEKSIGEIYDPIRR